MITYKGYNIYRTFSSGFYETYLGDRFVKADTLQGIKALINQHLKTL